MERKLILGLSLAAVAALSGAVTNASAAVVGYWRFEGDSTTFLNVEAGGLVGNLSLAGSSTPSASQVNTTAPNPVPLTNASNAKAGSFSGLNRLTATDDSDFTNNAFSIESFIFCTDLDGSANVGSGIAGHWNSATGGRSYMFGLSSAGKLQLELSPDGGSASIQTIVSSNGIATNKDYYVGVTVDLTAASNEVTFYLQNLTDAGTMLSENFSATQTALFNSSSAFSIGGKNASSNGSLGFAGRIDEVRLSTGKLSSSDLLAVPEPASLSLLAVAGGVIGRRRRA